MPGPMKFKLGVCVPHDEYMNPIVFGADPMSFGVKTNKKGDFVKFCEIVLVNTVSPDCLVRSYFCGLVIWSNCKSPYFGCLVCFLLSAIWTNDNYSYIIILLQAQFACKHAKLTMHIL